MGDSKVDPLSWTLRFKNHNVTVLLLVSPAEPWPTVKETLLRTLNSRNIKDINGNIVPEDPSEIEFGLPVDKNDLEKGWQKLEERAQENGEHKPSSSGKKSVSNANPQGAGLKDAQAVAFRFRKPVEGEQDEDTALAMDLDDPGWDVLIPKYDEDEE